MLRAGAEAYFDKPVAASTLAAAVASHLLRSGRAADEARIDRIIGLPNRAALAEQYHRLAQLSQRSGDALTLALVDVDRFKSVNDRYGHSAGDEVLRQTGALLRRAVCGTDLVARWGGGEFVVLLPGMPDHGSARALELALGDLRRLRLPCLEAGDELSFSAGIASCVEQLSLNDALDIAALRGRPGGLSS